MRGRFAAVLATVFAASLSATLPAFAQSLRIRSGEHEGYSRLVVPLPSAGDWSLRRTGSGYALRIADGTAAFDTAEVFRLIPRTRLSGLAADPSSGALNLSLACDCHAWAVELRRGALVIDIRDGPPPEDSPFETTEIAPPAPPRMSDTAPPDAAAPRMGYDWRRTLLPEAESPEPEPAKAAAPPPDANQAGPMKDWRNGLFNEISRGAARGIIDIAEAPPPSPDDGPPRTLPPQIRIGEGPVRAAEPDLAGLGLMTAEGSSCLPDALVAVGDWGDPAPVAQAIGPRTTAVLGEFDRPDPEAVIRAARYLIHLGFGAEARRMIDIGHPDGPESAVHRALSHIVDGTVPPPDARAFEGMLECDAAAALWAVLSLSSPEPARRARDSAVLRAFSALPLHLRRHLGPNLADRLLAVGKSETARAVRDAILRAPGEAGPAVDLMSLEVDRAAGMPADPERLRDLRATPGTTGLDATILSLEAGLAAGAPPDPALLLAAEALLREFQGTPDAARLARSLAPATASGGAIARAMDLSATDTEAGVRVWRILAETGSDLAILTHALRRAEDLPPPLPPEVERALAERLVALGFPREGRLWLAPSRRPGAISSPQDRLAAARSALAEGDPQTALRDVAGIGTSEAQEVRDAALLALGAPLRTDDRTDAPFAAIRARRNAQWDKVAVLDDEPWRAAAGRAPTPVGEPAATLAASRSLRDDSTETRSVLAALLQATRIQPAP